MLSKTAKSCLFLLLILLLTLSKSNAETPFSVMKVNHPVMMNVPGSFRGPGPNVKISPAIYWSTIGLEFEMPMGMMTFGVAGMYKFNERFGNDKNFKVRPEDYQQDGFRAEIFGRYFFRGEAPVGLFFEGKLFYNTIIYFDGNPMPYTLYNRWKELDGLRSPNDIKKPSPFGLGGATGIQVMVVPNAIIANLKVGLDLNQDNSENNNKLFLSIYLQPSIGITF
ncbi:hypothetical protein HZR84_08730 [Hyphobacterium sp. CCMP332]|nr:hypothetical protein HZR84_08730 [Hyphobacterium sp. CCMP332]